MWVNNPNYIRPVSVQTLVADLDKLKRGAEKRMAFYDEQPREVRALIGECNGIVPFIKEVRQRRLKRADSKANALRKIHMRQRAARSLNIA
jgi:hypothetical protein